MKKLILLLAIATFAFTSCKDDEKENPAPQVTIEGTWKANFLSYFRYNQTNMDTVATSTFPLSGALVPTFTFKSDGSFTGIDEGDSFSGTYMYNNNKLTLNSGGDTEEITVQSLTENELVLVETNVYTNNGETFYEQNTTTFVK